MQNLLELKPTMDDIERLQPFVAQTAEKAGIVGREAKRLRLAVEEAVANVINYGQATVITLRAATDVVAEEPGFSNVRTLQRRIQDAIGMPPVDYRLMLTRDL